MPWPGSTWLAQAHARNCSGLVLPSFRAMALSCFTSSYQRELDSGQVLIQSHSLLQQAHERIRWIVGLTVAMPALARTGGAVTKFARYENANKKSRPPARAHRRSWLDAGGPGDGADLHEPV